MHSQMKYFNNSGEKKIESKPVKGLKLNDKVAKKSHKNSFSKDCSEKIMLPESFAPTNLSLHHQNLFQFNKTDIRRSFKPSNCVASSSTNTVLFFLFFFPTEKRIKIKCHALVNVHMLGGVHSINRNNTLSLPLALAGSLARSLFPDLWWTVMKSVHVASSNIQKLRWLNADPHTHKHMIFVHLLECAWIWVLDIIRIEGDLNLL